MKYILNKRDDQVNVDIVNGTYADILFEPTYKVPKECRVCAGVAKIKTNISDDGQKWDDNGIRLKLFDYSEIKLCTNKTYFDHVDAEIARVKYLECSDLRSTWVEDHRQREKINEEDRLNLVHSVVPKTISCLRKVNTSYVKDLKHVPDENISEISNKYGLEIKIILTIKDLCENALPGKYPHEIKDHCKADKPYESKYGTNWLNVLKETKDMKIFVHVYDMIEHMVS